MKLTKKPPRIFCFDIFRFMEPMEVRDHNDCVVIATAKVEIWRRTCPASPSAGKRRFLLRGGRYATIDESCDEQREGRR
jgi:hypothetical protein